jgi:hypothetical protein
VAAPEPLLAVEVVFARPGLCWRWRGQLPTGARVRDAVLASGFVEAHPEVPWQQSVGVFAATVDPDHELEQGDRVEIYRPLVCDPMEARRRRAQAQLRR